MLGVGSVLNDPLGMIEYRLKGNAGAGFRQLAQFQQFWSNYS